MEVDANIEVEQIGEKNQDNARATEEKKQR
jgi:hypothetical protein